MAMSTTSQHDIETDRDKPLMVSALSTFSMVMGVASVLLLLLVVPAIATALLAIIFGHVSAAHIGANKADLLGMGRARIGLMLGYCCLALAVFLLPQMEYGRMLVKGMLASDRSMAVEDIARFSDGILGEHEREVSQSRESSDGDGPETARLAKNVRREIRFLLKDVLEQENRNGLAWDSSGLSCHCYLNSGLVFIVRDPDLAGFNDAALDALSRSAWRVALKTVQDSGEIEAGFPVAICIMGKRRCQTFVMGEAINVDDSLEEPSYSGPDSAQVLALFE